MLLLVIGKLFVRAVRKWDAREFPGRAALARGFSPSCRFLSRLPSRARALLSFLFIVSLSFPLFCCFVLSRTVFLSLSLSL